MEDIRDWLNTSNKSYPDGVQLYMKYGRDSVLRSLFTREEESAFKRDRLLSALKELWQNYKNPTSPAAAIKRMVEKQNPATNYKHWPEDADPVLVALREQWKPLYAEMMHLQARLYEVAEMGNQDPDRRMEASTMAHRILDLDDMCDEVYAKRDYYFIHGHLPTTVIENPEPVGDPVKWALKLQNAARYVRLYKQKVKDRPSDERSAALLKKYQEEQEKYKKLLKC